MCCRRLALMRLAPLSYFCTCWNVMPSASPRFVWLIPSIIRRIRSRPPTCLSIGLGSFLAIVILRVKRHGVEPQVLSDQQLDLSRLQFVDSTDDANSLFVNEGIQD